jgi:putative PIN family toxin of toxin-antitoxin system
VSQPPRWIADTNTLVSAFLWQGPPGQIIALAGDKRIQLVTSRALLDELGDVLHRPRLAKSVAQTGLNAKQMLESYKRLVTVVATRPLAQPVSRDSDDDAVLACAASARADLIVSGDKDLLVLGQFLGIPIVSVRDALMTVSQG